MDDERCFYLVCQHGFGCCLGGSGSQNIHFLGLNWNFLFEEHFGKSLKMYNRYILEHYIHGSEGLG
jgi:hypothetical protein